MNASYTLSARADQDLDEYADYLTEEESLDAALHFLAAAYRTLMLLSKHKGKQSHRGIQLAGQGAFHVRRVTGFNRILILYRARPKGIEVLRVVHGSRNVRSLLRRPESIP